MVVEVRTEFQPGVEFVRAEAALYVGRGPAGEDTPDRVRPSIALGVTDDTLHGVRAGTFVDVPRGIHLAQVRLFDGTGEQVGVGLTQVDFSTTRVVTVVISRACRTVDCPLDGAPTEIACVAGRCVDPRCVEEPERCPTPECERDDQCRTDGPSCVRGVCLAGFCADYPDNTMCESTECRLETGCEPAGFTDAGTDAGPPCIGVDGSSHNIGFTKILETFPTWNAVDASGAPGSATPHYYDVLFCNDDSVPHSFSLRIYGMGATPRLPSPALWGYRSSATPGSSDIEYRTAGVGNMTPPVTLPAGGRFTVRIGSEMEGVTGFMAAELDP